MELWLDTDMTNVLDTITTIDQNTGRSITWNIVAARDAGANVQAQYGWTHSFGVIRPKGRKLHAMWVEMIGDVVVRSTTPMKLH